NLLRSDRPMSRTSNARPAPVRHTEGTSALGVALSGVIDLRAQAEVLGALRTDTPKQATSVDKIDVRNAPAPPRRTSVPGTLRAGLDARVPAHDQQEHLFLNRRA